MSNNPSIRALIGLGNPGAEHAQQRHNAGFWYLDALLRTQQGVSFSANKKMQGEVSRLSLAGEDIHLLKPMTYMNRSGQAVQALMTYYKLKPQELLVIHDELDLPAGTLRLKRGGGHGGHNGLRDIIRHIGADFARLRVGIGHPGDKSQVLGYVLKSPSSNDQKLIDDSLLTAVDNTALILSDWQRATQKLHTKSSTPIQDDKS